MEERDNNYKACAQRHNSRSTMTFDPNVPNAGQSPGLFPAQNVTNMTRVKALINAEHVFNDTAQADDGVHRQMTMVARADPGALPAGTNGMLYTWIDGSARPQLKFWNGTTFSQLTPPEELLPIKISGSSALAGTASTNILNVAYNYSGTGWAIIQNGAVLVYRFYSFVRMGGVTSIQEINSLIGAINRPTLNFVGTILRATNVDAGAQTVTYSLIINRL